MPILQDIFMRSVWTREVVMPKAAKVHDTFEDIVQKSGEKPKVRCS
jgi:hypothetical protein